jgi:hypothetical protein
MARKTQLKLCNHVAMWMESYFVQTCVAQNIFAQHDWSLMLIFDSLQIIKNFRSFLENLK